MIEPEKERTNMTQTANSILPESSDSSKGDISGADQSASISSPASILRAESVSGGLQEDAVSPPGDVLIAAENVGPPLHNSVVSDPKEAQQVKEDKRCGGVLERRESFDAMLNHIQQGNEDFLNNSSKHPSHTPAETPEATWDFTLKSKASSAPNSRASIWLTDTDFLRKLEEYNAFMTCDHEVVKIPCPCPNKETFSICAKCHRVFCSNKCVKITKEAKIKGDPEISSPRNDAYKTSSEPTTISTSSLSESDTPSTAETLINSSLYLHGGRSSANTSQSAKSPESVKVRPGHQHFKDQSLPKPQTPPFGNRPNPQFCNFPRNYGPPQLSFMGLGMPPRGFPFSPNCPPFPASLLGPPGPGLLVRPPLVEPYFPPRSRIPFNNYANSPFASGNIPNWRNNPTVVQKPKDEKILRDPREARRASLKDVHGISSKTNSPCPSIPTTISISSVITEPKISEPTDVNQVQQFRGLGRGKQSPTSSPTPISPSAPTHELQSPPAVYPSRFSNPNNVPNSKSEKAVSEPENAKTAASPANILEQQQRVQKRPAPTSSPPVPKALVPSTKFNQTRPSIVSNAAKLDQVVDFKKFPISQEPFVLFGVPMQVGFSYGHSFFDFYVWNAFGNSNNDRIVDCLSKESRNILPLTNPNVGDYCVAKYTNDQVDGWYRARILEVKFNKVKVFFIDYGNEELLGEDAIKQIPAALLEIRPSVIRMCMGGFEPSRSEKDLEQAFASFIVDQWIRATIFENASEQTKYPISNYEAKLEIKHQDEWFDIAEILEKDELGKKNNFGENASPTLKTNQELSVKVSHVNHLNDFYVVPEESQVEREKIKKHLNSRNTTYDDFLVDKWSSTNYVCIAQRNGQWARAKIIQVTEDCKAEIRFIDYGNTVNLPFKDLKSIPLELLNTAQLAHKCSLSIFPVQGKWDFSDPEFNILQQLCEKDEPIFVYVYTFEAEEAVHIVEVFQGEKRGGLTKSLLKKKNDACTQEYTADLDIRQKLKPKKPEEIVSGSSRASIPTEPKIDEIPNPTASVAPSISSEQHQVKTVPSASSVRQEPVSSTSSTHPLSVCNLKHSQPLDKYLDAEFEITNVEGFNKICIRPTEHIEVERLLQSDIFDCVDEGKHFEEPPPINTVVIVQFTEGNYYRAVLKKVSKRNVKVELLDVGCSWKLPMKGMIPAAKSLLKYPKLTFEVKLSGVDDDPGLLLQSDFAEVIRKLVGAKYSLESCIGDHEPYTVVLKNKNGSPEDSFSERILAKQIWEWERLFNSGNLTEATLFSKMRDKDKIPAKEEHLQIVNLPMGSLFEGNISRFSSEGDIFVVNIQEDFVRRDHRVLQNQISRFAEKVASVAYFPILGELVLIYLPDIPKIREVDSSLYGIGKWNRCVKETSTYFRNVDYDEIYPADAVKSEHFVCRKLPPEFLRIACGVVPCVLKGFQPSQAMQLKLNSELKQKKKVRCRVDHFDEENDVYVITINGFNF